MLLIVARSFLALKKQNGFEMRRNVLKISCAAPWPSASLVAIGRSGEFAALVIGASIGLPITNLSDIVPRLRVDVRLPFTNHQSLLTSLSDIALATSDHGRASGLTVRLQDLFLVLSQCVDLGLLSITAAFSASRDNLLHSRRRPRPRIRPRGVLRQF